MLIACHITACMSLLCWRQLQHPASCTQHSPWLSCCLRRSCPAPDMASSAAWCCSTCCCCSQGDAMTTHAASMPAEQLQPVLQLHQHLQRGWPPAATASALCCTLSPLALPHSLTSFHPSDACSIACGPASHAHASLSALVLWSWAPDGGQSQTARMAKGLHRKQIDTIKQRAMGHRERTEVAGA